MSGDAAQKEVRFHGAGVSPGIARGVVHVVRDDLEDVPRYAIQSADVPGEIGRFEAALAVHGCTTRAAVPGKPVSCRPEAMPWEGMCLAPQD